MCPRLPALEELEAAFLAAQEDEAFQAELAGLLARYAGRPTPLTRCRNLGGARARIYLKREDLLHGGAHKTNQVLGQALLAKKMGKTRLIAETGAGQHGFATAIAGALFGFRTRIYMGAHDVERQVTGAETQMRLNHADLFRTLEEFNAPPPVLGFGISTPGHVRSALAAGAAGAISGSAIVKIVETDPDPLPRLREFIAEMKAACRLANAPAGCHSPSG